MIELPKGWQKSPNSLKYFRKTFTEDWYVCADMHQTHWTAYSDSQYFLNAFGKHQHYASPAEAIAAVEVHLAKQYILGLAAIEPKYVLNAQRQIEEQNNGTS